MVVHEYEPGEYFQIGSLPLCASKPVSITAVQLSEAKGVILAGYAMSRPSPTPDVQPASYRGPISDFDKEALRSLSVKCEDETSRQFLALQLPVTEDGASTTTARLDYSSEAGAGQSIQILVSIAFCLKDPSLPQCTSTE